MLFYRLRSRFCDSSLCLCACPCLDSTTKTYWSLSFSFTDLSWGSEEGEWISVVAWPLQHCQIKLYKSSTAKSSFTRAGTAKSSFTRAGAAKSSFTRAGAAKSNFTRAGAAKSSFTRAASPKPALEDTLVFEGTVYRNSLCSAYLSHRCQKRKGLSRLQNARSRLCKFGAQMWLGSPFFEAWIGGPSLRGWRSPQAPNQGSQTMRAGSPIFGGFRGFWRFHRACDELCKESFKITPSAVAVRLGKEHRIAPTALKDLVKNRKKSCGPMTRRFIESVETFLEYSESRRDDGAGELHFHKVSRSHNQLL